MKKVAFVLMTLFLFGSLQSFAGNAHVECNLTNTDVAKVREAEKRVDDMLRSPASRIRNEASSLDSAKEPNK